MKVYDVIIYLLLLQVRSITCWSLSRFSKWLVEAATGAAQGTTPPPGGAPDTMSKEYGQRQLDGVINALLRRILDNNKRVQEASCSAMATLEEQAGAAGELACRAETILQHLMVAFNHYQVRKRCMASNSCEKCIRVTETYDA